VSDATWLAQLGAHGLVRSSFVPPEQLRDLTRVRTAITRERGRELQRLEKLLQDAPDRGPAGRFTEHHTFLARVHLDLIDRHPQAMRASRGAASFCERCVQRLPEASGRRAFGFPPDVRRLEARGYMAGVSGLRPR
jgi:hypothetical protein